MTEVLVMILGLIIAIMLVVMQFEIRGLNRISDKYDKLRADLKKQETLRRLRGEP